MHEKVRYHLGFDKNFAIHRSNVTMLRINVVAVVYLLISEPQVNIEEKCSISSLLCFVLCYVGYYILYTYELGIDGNYAVYRASVLMDLSASNLIYFASLVGLVWCIGPTYLDSHRVLGTERVLFDNKSIITKFILMLSVYTRSGSHSSRLLD